MKKEIRIFFTALMYYTRIPCPSWISHDPEYLQKSIRYLPLTGVITGAAGALTYLLTSLVFPAPVSILLSMAVTVWITGAFHEDGLADVCDGFGGGWQKDRILHVMKDSRIGTFGVTGLFFTLSLKFAALLMIPHALIPAVLVSGHSVSRLMSALTSFAGTYVRESDTKAGPAISGASAPALSVIIVTGLSPLFFFGEYTILLTLLPLLAITAYLLHFYKKWIGGYTGDCLGATQQVCEVVFYLCLPVLWKYT